MFVQRPDERHQLCWEKEILEVTGDECSERRAVIPTPDLVAVEPSLMSLYFQSFTERAGGEES